MPTPKLGANHPKYRATVSLRGLIIRISAFRKKHARLMTLLRTASERNLFRSGQYCNWFPRRHTKTSHLRSSFNRSAFESKTQTNPIKHTGLSAPALRIGQPILMTTKPALGLLTSSWIFSFFPISARSSSGVVTGFRLTSFTRSPC
jgi:hypothetical protein